MHRESSGVEPAALIRVPAAARWRGLAALLALTAVLAGARAVQAQADIVVINRDRAGEGFNDETPVDPVGGNDGTTLGEQRLIVFRHAAEIWSAIVESSVEIRVGAAFDPLPCGGSRVTLGVAGPNNLHRDFKGAPRPDTFYADALADSLAGVDLCPPGQCPESDDLSATFNSILGTQNCTFPPWYMGLDGNPPNNQPDLATTVLHELGHGLGFLTFMDTSTGRGFMNADDAYMVHLEDHLIGKTFPEMTLDERKVAARATGDLHWVGPSVVAASRRLTQGRHPSGHVEMYAPAQLSPGGSVSHFSDFLSPNELMEPFDNGPIPSVGLARELLEDLGWRLVGANTMTPTPTVTPTPTQTRPRTTTPTRRSTSTRLPTRTRSGTPTRTRTRTPTITGTPPTATATPTPLPPDTCLGDCDVSGDVSSGELVMGVGIALGAVPMSRCGAFDVVRDGVVSVEDLISAVDHALNECPEQPAVGIESP
jgi:hypothetical protein